jgi:nitronate monooxygenase
MKRALRHARLKHYARMYYSVKSIFELRRASLQGVSYRDFFQAGKSVGGIEQIEPAAAIVAQFAAAARARAA